MNKAVFSKTSHSFVKRCLNVKSGYQKRGRFYGDPIICFLRASTFYIGFNIMFLKILNRKIKRLFLSNYDYFC